MNSLPVDALALKGSRFASGGFSLSALGALFVLTLRQHVRGRRLLVLSLLFLLPSLLAGLVRLAPYPPTPAELEFAFVFNLIPHALITLTTLLYAAGIIQDEIEEQTLTYLLARPLPRWALYITKLAASFVTTVALTSTFTLVTLAVIYWNTAELWGEVLPGRALRVLALLALAQAGYCAFFGLLGMITRRSLIFGLAYIVAFEGLLANLDFVARKLTTMYYFRVLSMRWLNPSESTAWSIDLATAPTMREGVLILLGTSMGFMVLGAMLMMWQEFRMKTPGES
jgi:ABC-2 type transport system permease protein